jgi:hypothetical protein
LADRFEAVPASDPLRSPRITVLTREFMNVRARLLRDNLHQIARLGGILAKLRNELRPEGFTRWCRLLRVSLSASRHWIAVHHVHRAAPEAGNALLETGRERVYRLGQLSDAGLRAVLRDQSPRQLSKMQRGKFLRITAPHVRFPRAATPGRVAHGMAEAVQAWVERLKKARVDPAVIGSPRARLAEALRAIIREARGILARMKLPVAP